MSDARETANCSFPGITHISEKISRCCYQLTRAKYSNHIMHYRSHILRIMKTKIDFSKTTTMPTNTDCVALRAVKIIDESAHIDPELYDILRVNVGCDFISKHL